MVKRKVVEIDEEKCNGCGECIPQCHEGALQIIDGKARLVSDRYCDGLGACLGTCPQDAIRIIERDADEFDEEAVEVRLQKQENQKTKPQMGGCPGAAAFEIGADRSQRPVPSGSRKDKKTPSALSQWPVQLRLVPVDAPYFDGADLLIAADCAPFAYADFHAELLAGRKLLIGCPKLDDGEFYRDKLKEIFEKNDLRSVTVAHMEVPCCHGLLAIVRSALDAAKVDLEVNIKVLSVNGELRDSESVS